MNPQVLASLCLLVATLGLYVKIKLALLGVTDEPDQSVQPYTHYVSAFQSLKSTPDNVIFHSLGGLCNNGGNTGVENVLLIQGAQYTISRAVVDAASLLLDRLCD